MRPVGPACAAGLWAFIAFAAVANPSVADYESIQAAIDANPGKRIHVPQGTYAVDTKIRIAGNGGGLYGFGVIRQSNPAEPVLEIEHAENVLVRDVTLTRTEGANEATASALLCWDSRHVAIDNVTVNDNWARNAAIEIRESKHVTVRNTTIRNYKRIAIDDRTQSEHYGYAFRCIDGTGILVDRSTHTRLIDNTVTDSRLLPTRENKEAYGLGTVTLKADKRGALMSKSAWTDDYVRNWHQGSAIIVTGPEHSAHTLVRGNQIEHAAQAIDLHCDEAIIDSNVIDYCMIGVKMTHGCRDLIVRGNLIGRVDLWGILVNPGAASHAASPATESRPARPANTDRAIAITDNIVTDYGYGHEYWNWGGSYAIAILRPQLPAENPALQDVILRGNIVHATGREGVLRDGELTVEAPRHVYALYVEPWDDPETGEQRYPENIVTDGNILHPGTRGITNYERP